MRQNPFLPGINKEQFVKLEIRTCHGRIMAYLMTKDGQENGPLWTKQDANERITFLWDEGTVDPLFVIDLLLAVQTSKLPDSVAETCHRMVSVSPGLRITLDVVGRAA